MPEPDMTVTFIVRVQPAPVTVMSVEPLPTARTINVEPVLMTVAIDGFCDIAKAAPAS